jgi:DNA uptake protein ComE-like DNA-binding protein
MTRRREENSGATKRRTGKKRTTDVEDWRVDGLPRERRSGKRSTAAGAPAPPRPPKPSRRSGRGSEWLPASGKRRRSRSRNGNGNGRAGIEELERRTAELERKLRNERRRAQEEIAKLRAQLRERKPAGKRGAKPSPSGRLDANAASFEQLRELGFTPSQSAKLIARRESAGGFKAKSDLRRIAGLSKAARELVEKRLSVRR